MPDESIEKYCLKWNEYESNLSTAFQELWRDQEFFDVTLVCQDTQIQAHKVMLSASSPFFKSIFSKNPHNHPLIYLKDVKLEIIQLIIKFIYQGEVNVTQGIIQSFLSTAADLKIKGLTQDGQKPGKKSRSVTPSPQKSVKPGKRKIEPEISPVDRIKKVPKVEPVEVDETPLPNSDDLQNGTNEQFELHSQVDLDVSDGQSGYEEGIEEVEEILDEGEPQEIQPDFHSIEVEETTELPEDLTDDLPSDHMTDDLSNSDHLNTSQDIHPDLSIESVDSQNIDLESYYFPVQMGQQCRLCGHLSQTKRLIKVHLEGKHGLSLGYTCDICNKFLKTNEALRIHKRRRHRINAQNPQPQQIFAAAATNLLSAAAVNTSVGGGENAATVASISAASALLSAMAKNSLT